jgi:PAS domain S-box-containing protein
VSRQIAQALREHDAQYQALVRASIDGFLVVDADRRVLDANQAFCNLLGYTLDQLRLMHIDEFDVTQDRAMLDVQTAEVVRRGWMRFEARHRRADGSLVEVEVSSLHVPEQGRFLTFVRDLTDRRRAEAALLDHERRYQALVGGAMDGFLVSGTDGRVVDANEALSTMLGYPRDVLVGMNVWDFDQHFRPSTLEARTRRIFEMGRSRFETSYRTAAGDTLDVEVSAWVLPDGHQVMAFVRDITARRRAEAELRHSEEQLRQAQKLEAIGRLAGGVAHDFNNLLTVINASATLALDRLSPDDPLWPVLQEIQHAGARGANLTRQLLTFSRRQLVHAQIIDLNEIVTDLDRMLRRLIGEDVVMTVRLEREPVRVKADPGQVEQALVNLAVNARDAMPHGGHLAIETTRTMVPEPSAAVSRDLPPGSYVTLSVADTGVGMDGDTLKRIFEPFFTTKGALGTGLGLPTVYGIVKQCGGHVLVHSQPGCGTRFELHFPASTETPAAAATEGPRPPVHLGGETVLLVEDDASVRQIVKLILETGGYQVLAASGGEEALAIAGNTGTKIDIVITDMVMPRMGGAEVARRLRAMRPGLKVIYSSGYSEDVLGRQGPLDPDMHFVPKPFDIRGLRAKVRAVLDE